MVLVLDNIFVGCVTSINGWWIVRERNRCVYKEENTQVYFNISALVMQWNVCDFVRWLSWPVCLVNEYADRHISSCVRCAWLLVSYCDVLLMLQPQGKRRRMWSCVNLSFIFITAKWRWLSAWNLKLFLVQEPLMGCSLPWVVPHHKTGDALHSPGIAAIVGLLAS